MKEKAGEGARLNTFPSVPRTLRSSATDASRQLASQPAGAPHICEAKGCLSDEAEAVKGPGTVVLTLCSECRSKLRGLGQ